MTAIDDLITIADTFAAARGISRARVSTLALGNGGRLQDLADGRVDIGVRTLARAVAWFDAHWPAGLDWPAGIPRPAEAGPHSRRVEPASSPGGDAAGGPASSPPRAPDPDGGGGCALARPAAGNGGEACHD